jgi:sugar phosphate isomerase/epimerase
MHERISVNGMCFPGASFRDQVGYWKELGARRVSFISPTLLAEGLAPARDALATGDCRLETIAHGPFSSAHLTSQEESWAEGRATLTQLIEAAEQLGARSVYMLTGGHGTLSWEETAESFSAAIAPCVAHAKQAGIELMIEAAPALYADLHIAHSLRDALTLAEMAGIGVCMDLSGCWTEARLRDSIARAVPRCHLVQLSDYLYGDRALPSRAVPGDGAIPIERILDWVLAAGYAGAFDLELIGPRIDAEGHLDAVRRAADRTGEILHALGA